MNAADIRQFGDGLQGLALKHLNDSLTLQMRHSVALLVLRDWLDLVDHAVRNGAVLPPEEAAIVTRARAVVRP